MVIAVPKEIMHGENRVAVTPELCAAYVKDGHRVLVGKGAGDGAHFPDADYRAAGAEIVDGARELFRGADLILKVKEPMFDGTAGCHETDLMRAGQVLITFIHPAAPANHDMVRGLARQGVTALTLDGVPRITRAQNMDALTSMSTCAGYKGILMAANLLPSFVPQMFSAAGAIRPASALIVGAGVAGLQALATAKRLGAVTFAADIRASAREQAQSLGAKIIDVGVSEEEACGAGGYARQLSDGTLQRERELLGERTGGMDIVFLSALVPGRRAPLILTDRMLRGMKPGSVVVDISVDQGGNCEQTEPGETAVRHGVQIVGIKNIPGLLPASSTWMFSRNVYNLVKYLVRDGRIVLDDGDEIVRGILTTRNGEILHQGAREAMGL